MYKKNYTGDEKPFNFAQLLLERCNILFQKSNEARVDGDPFLWYKVLSAIKTAVSFKLENEEIETLEKSLTTASAKIRNARNLKTEAFFFEVEKALDGVEKEIVRLMYKYRLYYPHYEVKSVEDEIVEGYE